MSPLCEACYSNQLFLGQITIPYQSKALLASMGFLGYMWFSVGLLFGCHIRDSGELTFVRLFLPVTIQNGDGHNEKTNVGLGRNSRREGEREGRRIEDGYVQYLSSPAPWPTSMMMMTGAMKAQMK